MRPPPEIDAVIGLRIDPELWDRNCRAAIAELEAGWPNLTDDERSRLAHLKGDYRKLLDPARRGERSPLRWYVQGPGRWATKGPNVHAITKDFGMRDAVIPAEGKVFVQGDWRGAHLVIAAGLSGDEQLRADLEAGDAYDRATSVLVPELDQEGRGAAKKLILSSLNGAGPANLAAALLEFGVSVTEAEASRRRALWLSRYPTLGRYMEEVLRDRSWRTPLDRTVTLPADEPSYKGLGWRWQSYEADALILALRYTRALHPGADVALVVYDEILLEVAEAEAEAVRGELAWNMDRAIREVAGLAEGEPDRTVKTSIRKTWSGIEGEASVANWGSPLELSAALLTDDPPPQRWLVNWPSGGGFLERSTVGILASDGGLGKTRAMIELACCLADGRTGRDWLAPTFTGHGTRAGFPIAAEAYGTRTLLLLAEERAPNVRRRLHWAIRDTGTNPEAVARNVVVFPFGDRSDLALTRPDRHTGSTVPTGVERQLKESIDRYGPFGLVVLDPLSAFASSETELSSEAATKLFAILARVVGDDGPTILLTHHVSKGSQREGERTHHAIRGSTGLVNRARWVAQISPASAQEPAELRVSKANDARRGSEKLLEDRHARGRLFLAPEAPPAQPARAARDPLA